MFLLSLMPEVEHFSKDQIKLFKRKMFSVIDEISSQSFGNTPSNALEYYSNFSGTVENFDEERESSFTPL